MTGSVFSKEYIDQEKIEPIPQHLIPWIKADIRDVLENEIPKARKMVARTQRDRLVILNKIEKCEDSEQSKVLNKQIEFIDFMNSVNKSRLEFYDGKIYLLNKRLEKS